MSARVGPGSFAPRLVVVVVAVIVGALACSAPRNVPTSGDSDAQADAGAPETTTASDKFPDAAPETPAPDAPDATADLAPAQLDLGPAPADLGQASADLSSHMPDPSGARRPFQVRIPYQAGVFPSAPQAALDAATVALYQGWKRQHLVTGCGGVYVKAGGGFNAQLATVSHLQGVGMLIAAIFAGQDTDARNLFHALFAVARRYPSIRSPMLMTADLLLAGAADCSAPVDASAATDGDMHIALALLMADQQWGSAGAIDYLTEARNTIAAITRWQMNPTTKLPMPGDHAASDPAAAARLRPSDLMLGHYAAFARATGEGFWGEASAVAVALLGKLPSQLGLPSGLWPDFVDDAGAAMPRAAAGEDGTFGYHAIRVPLWLGADAATNGGDRGRAVRPILARATAFLRGKTGDDPGKIVDGYHLDGAVSGGSQSVLFEAAFAVAAMLEAGADDAAWRDALWTRISAPRDGGGYEQTMQLLAAIVLSGHWWQP